MHFADSLIRKFGTDITVKSSQTPEGRQSRGIISPIEFAGFENMQRREKPGSAGRAKYLLIACRDAFADGESGVTVKCGSMEYELMRLESIHAGRGLSHCEGILRLKGRVSENA